MLSFSAFSMPCLSCVAGSSLFEAPHIPSILKIQACGLHPGEVVVPESHFADILPSFPNTSHADIRYLTLDRSQIPQSCAVDS